MNLRTCSVKIINKVHAQKQKVDPKKTNVLRSTTLPTYLPTYLNLTGPNLQQYIGILLKENLNMDNIIHNEYDIIQLYPSVIILRDKMLLEVEF